MAKTWGCSFKGQSYGQAFDCPGCKLTHVVNVAAHPDLPNAHVWQWNGSQDAPTFSPSLLVRTGHHVTGQSAAECYACGTLGARACIVCHSFVTDGRIQFLGDCTHELAGQTVELPEVPAGKAYD